MIDVQTVWRRVKGRWASLRRVPALFLFSPSPGAEEDAQALAAFGHWCEAHQGEACRVNLSGQWLLHSVPASGADAQSSRQQAMQQWAHYLDLDEATIERDWVVRVVHTPARGLMCAAPRAIIDGLRTHARNHGVKLEWVGPWWAYGVQAWLANLPSTVQANDTHTLHLIEPGLMTHVQASAMPGQAGTLQRIWSDRGPAAGKSGVAASVSIRAPTLDDQVDAAISSNLWDQSVLQPLLTGMDACWRAPA